MLTVTLSTPVTHRYALNPVGPLCSYMLLPVLLLSQLRDVPLLRSSTRDAAHCMG